MTDTHTASLLVTRQHHLEVLQRQLATFGELYAPPHIITGIAQTQAEISQLRQQRTQQIPRPATLASAAPPAARGLIVLISPRRPTERLEDMASYQALLYHRQLTHCWLIATSGEGGSLATAHELARYFSGVQSTIWQVLDPTAPFTRASDAVARGNLKVFAEIAREFARFYATCLKDDAYDGVTIDAFCTGLRPGDPPDGQHYLRDAFARYYEARFEPDGGRRAQLLLLANVEIGFHEQTRLQPEIVAAMESPVIDPRQLRDRVLAALFPADTFMARVRRAWDRLRGRSSPIDPAVDRLVTLVRDEARFLISDQLMAIELPQATRLRLGRDLRAAYPPALQAITEPALRDLLARIDPTPDTPRDSGATDWGDLLDRLHFILELFRCYQEWPPLYDPPYSPEQVAVLKAGVLPKGRL